MARLLILDDSPEIRASLEDILVLDEHTVIAAADVAGAKKILEKGSFELILSDVEMPGQSGVEFARWLKSHEDLRYVPLMLVTAKSELKDIVAGLEAGADDYITKPFKPVELRARVRAALRTKEIYQALYAARELNATLSSQINSAHNMLGESSKLQEVQRIIERVALVDVPVLITGETGTGKELAARAVHTASMRAKKPFIALNCSGFREELLASELFGHVKGSFTGAIKDKPGMFELADGGTLFLDELGEMPLPVQAVLLRVLQDGTFVPVGGTEPKRSSVRVVAATNKDLLTRVAEGKFREDLLFRINVVSIEMPPLRSRGSDIITLATHFIREAAQRFNLPPMKIADDALQKLVAYSWPGNVRQLKNEIERAILLCRTPGYIEAEDILQGMRGVSQSDLQLTANEDYLLEPRIKHLEREMLAKALEKTRDNRSEAAKLLGISRSNLIAKIKEYGLADFE